MTKGIRLLFNLKLIFLLLLLENVATTPVVNLPKTAAASKRNDTACKFLFHVKGDKENGQFYVTGITMPPLDQIIKETDKSTSKNKIITTSNVGANCVPQFMVQQNNAKLTNAKDIQRFKKQSKKQKQTTWSVLKKKNSEEEDSSEEEDEEIDVTLIDDSQPLYEQQEVVYPSDDEKIVDIISTSTTTTTESPTTISTSTSRKTTLPTSTIKPKPKPLEKAEKTSVNVEENYRYYQPDGTGEYKLMLSNGMTDYKRIYKKKVGDREIIAQSGYYTVPRMDNKKGFQIQYYVADENGQRVYTDTS